MIGTIANTVCILVGSLLGGLLHSGLKQKYQDALFVAMGLAATGLGINAVVGSMPESGYPVLFIASLAIGGVIGTALDIDGRFARLIDRIQERGAKRRAQQVASTAPAGNADAAGTQVGPAAPKPSLAEGLATAITLFCFGTLSILGPINSALMGDETYLFTNAMLDLVTSMALASTFGFGIAAAAFVLFAWQGAIFLLATQLAPLLTAELMCEISIVGGFLILASGLSILEIKKISVMNFLPALLIPPLWFAVVGYLPFF